MVRLEECLGRLDCVISVIQKICVRYKNVYSFIGISVLNILIYFLHLEVHFLWIKGDRSLDIGTGIGVIVEYSVEKCVWLDVHG